MPYEKNASTRAAAASNSPSFEVLYTGLRSGYDPNHGQLAGGFQLMSTPAQGEANFSKFIAGQEANRIVWLFNTTSSTGDTAHGYSPGTVAGKYENLPGVTSMSFYQADCKTLIGSVTHSKNEGWDRVGGGTSQQGYISSPPPIVKFTISASHDMTGILKVVNSAVGDYGDKTKFPII